MDAEAISLLRTAQGEAALALAGEQPDPGGLAAARALRRRFPPELALVALTQAELRARARTKFGDRASSLYLTRDGLEQATRPEVAAHHAARFVAAGVHRVVDLGCGIGSDALAFVEAGLEVVCVELDPATAEIARLNLGDAVPVLVGDAEELAPGLLADADGAFCDPARRTSSGRLWRVEDFRPSWDLVRSLLGSDRVVGVKLGPALPHSLVPPGVEAEWVSHRGDTLEVGLWSTPADRADPAYPAGRVDLADSSDRGGWTERRVALVLPDARLEVPAHPPELATAPPGAYVYEPDGAVIRAGAIGVVGDQIQGWLLDPRIAYLSSDSHRPTPFATAFRVREVLPYQEKVVRGWLAEHQVGSLEIKKRGVDVDPAQLRRRLNLTGSGHATLILTRTPRAALAIVADRI